MIGGIYAECTVGVGKDITYKLLASDAPIKVKRIDKKLKDLVNIREGIEPLIDIEEEPHGTSLISDFLISIAKTSFSRRASASHRRGFFNRTVDLMHSFGIATYRGGIRADYAQFTGGHSEATPQPHSKANHPDPASRLNLFTAGYAKESVTKGKLGLWSVCFVATMPYAVRLEYEYSKNVLLGQIRTIIGQFHRDFTRLSINSSIQTIDSFKYGYIFEKTGGNNPIIGQ